ncbi:YceD family protein [Paenibacillus polymyxa]|uniref:YceD family protein n=1 Tax=Paenibacillus polymyxa TaxID=1406 RepID=UPI003B594203
MQLFFRKVATSDGPFPIRESLNVSELVDDRADVTAVSPLETDLVAVSLDQGSMSVEGTLTAGLDMLCSRCLSPMHEDLNIEFRERFKQTSSSNVEEEDEDGDFIAVTEDSFDIAPYCEELFVLHVPFAPICSEDCQGIAPAAGQDWSLGSDDSNDSDTEKIDPRLAGLKDFFK